VPEAVKPSGKALGKISPFAHSLAGRYDLFLGALGDRVETVTPAIRPATDMSLHIPTRAGSLTKSLSTRPYWPQGGLVALVLLVWAPLLFSAESLPFSSEGTESAWIKQHPVIRVGVDPDWAPFSFRDKQGTLQGIDLEILKLLAKQTGLTFEISSRASWSEVIQAARNGEYDLLTSTAMTSERQKDFIFSVPYFQFPVALITRQSEPFLISLNQLTQRRLATPRGHVTTEAVAADYPEMKLLLTATTAESLRMVSRGQADATLAQLAHASYLIRELGLTNLKVSGLTDYQFDLRYAIRPDWPEVQTLLNKSLPSLPHDEVAEILSRWIHVERGPWTTWKTMRNTFWTLMIVIISSGLLLILWNTLQRREIARRRLTEKALKLAYEKLEKMNEDKNSIMQMVAHDLRNPLTGIMAGADFVRLETAGHAGHAVTESLDEIIQLSKRIQKLVDQLVTVTALESGHQIFKCETYEAKVAVRRAVESLRAKALAKRIELLAAYPQAECVATGDVLALERIVENLVSNGIKFSQPGSSVRLDFEVKEDWLVLRVEDHGPGFTEEDKKYVFQKFSHLSAKPTAGETSTGLGLPIVKALVTALHGEIFYESTAGLGTTFTVTLPRHGKIKV
jgi:two-component system, NarL family, sensor histidine kinase EvgS